MIDIHRTAGPKISIVTPSYEQADYIEETIQSVIDQSYENKEYVVIDGGSRDGTQKILEKYSKNIDYWCSQPDSGQSEAINKGFARTSGEILYWLNSDDILEEGALDCVASAFERTDEPAWLIGASRILDETSGVVTVRQTDEVNIETFVKWFSQWFPQQSTFFTRCLFEQVGPIREDLHYCMDLDLWQRMYSIVKPIILPNILSSYRLHKEAKCSRNPAAVRRELVDIVMHDDELKTASYNALVNCEEKDIKMNALYEETLSRYEETLTRCRELERQLSEITSHPVFGRAIRLWYAYLDKKS